MGGDLQAAKNRVAQEYPGICGACASATTEAPEPSEPCAPGGSAWLSDAAGHTCGSRIEWVSEHVFGNDLEAAKRLVASEYPSICGACSPAMNTCMEGGTVWHTDAAGHTCGSRITWVQNNLAAGDLLAAKAQVASEYPG